MRSLFIAALLATRLLRAQTFEGTLLLADQKSAVQGAKVRLTTPRGDIVDSAISDGLGGFSVRAPRGGRYEMVVRRPGFLAETTEGITLVDGETLRDVVVLSMGPEATSLEGQLRAEVRRILGVEMRNFDRHNYVGPDAIERVSDGAYDVGSTLRWLNLPNVDVRPGRGSDSCIRLRAGLDCAMIFLDGQYVGQTGATVLPDDLEALVLLRPIEMGTIMARVGLDADPERTGIVLAFTRRHAQRAMRRGR